MREKKFTPGPWGIKDEWVVVANIAVCKLPPLHDNFKANAHLIAAAPELLEALEGLLVLCMSEPMEDSVLEFAAAEKALSKAYGEQP